MKSFLVVLSAIFSLMSTTVSDAGIVYDNGFSGNYNGGLIFSQFMPVNNFVLSSSANVTGADIFISQRDDVVWDNAIEWMIFGYNGSSPASVISSGAGSNYSVTSTLPHSTEPRSLIEAHFDFGNGVSLTAGQSYWFGIHAFNVTAGQDGLIWRNRDVTRVGGPAYTMNLLSTDWQNPVRDQYDSNSEWTSHTLDPRFRLTDTTVVPEPISYILFIIGGATLGFRRFWNKRKAI